MKRFDIPLLAVLAVSMFGNAFLGYQNIRLREGNPRNEANILGSTLTSLAFKNDQQEAVELRFPSLERPVLLYSISSTCRWCASNAGMARALEVMVRNDYQFITVCMDGNVEGCRTKTGSGPIYMPTPEVASILELGTVPQTILVAPSGRVERVWTGAYQKRNKEELEKFFGAPLDE